LSMRPTARVARGATYFFVQGFLTSLINIGYFIVLAHALSREDMGVFALINFILSLLVTLGTFGLQSAIVKYIAQHLAENDAEKARAVFSRVLQIGFLAGAVAFFLLLVPAEPISSLIIGQSGYATILQLLALCSIFVILNSFVLSSLQGIQKMREASAITMANTLIRIAVSTYFLLTGWGLYAIIWGWLAGLVLTTIAGLYLTIRSLGFTSRLYPIKPLLGYSLPLYISGGIGLLVTWVDQLVLASLTNLQTLGIYYVAVSASVVPALFSSSVVTVLFPKLSELYTKQGATSLKDAFRVAVRYSVLIGFPLTAGVAILAYPTIILFAGAKYAEAALPLIIISLAAFPGALGIALGPILLTLAKTKLASLLSLVSITITVLFSFFTLQVLGLGMIGTACARTLASVVVLILSLYFLARLVPLSFDNEAIWKATAASTFMVLVITGLDLCRWLLAPSSYQFLVIRLYLLPIYILAGGLAYFVAIVALKALKRQDLELVQEYLPKKLRFVADLLNRVVRVE
jgi:O-antigen/teichoic acid export membrane protein